MNLVSPQVPVYFHTILRRIAGAMALAAIVSAQAGRLGAAVNDLVINEYNSVSGSNYLGGINSDKVDNVFGRLEGNGQNWMEFLVVKDHLDLRGYKFEWSYNQDFLGIKAGSGAMTFTQEPLWSDLRQGTIITITEWQEAWYKDEGLNTSGLHNFSRQGGVNGIGNQRNNAFAAGTHTFVDLSTDLRFNPELGDWHINVFAGEREPSTGDYKYFTFNGTTTLDGNATHANVGIDDDAGVFAVNNDNWEGTIRDGTVSHNVVFGPVGEAVAGFGGGGINSGEVAKIEHDDFDTIGAPPTEATYRTASNGSFRDGSSSTFGGSNLATGYVQDVSQLRLAAFNAADVKSRNSTANSAFSDGTKWAGGAAPTATQQATFNQGSGTAYNVTFSGATQTDSLVVRNDRVNFDLGGNTYTTGATAEYKPSVVVGQSTGQTAVVSLTNGTLAGGSANIAQQTGSNGSLTVGSGGILSLSKSLFVAGADDRRGGTGSLTVGAGGRLVVGDTAKVFSTGTLSTTAGATTIGSGTQETTAGTLRIWSTGTLDLRGGAVSASNVALSGGTIGGYGTLSSNITANSGKLYVVNYDDTLAGQLTLSGSLTSGVSSTLTKLGGGTLTIAGSQSHGAGSLLNLNAGTTNLNSDAGGNLAINAAAKVNFGSSQHLGSLTVASGVTATALAGGDKIIVTGGLNIAGATNAWTGKLDLNDGSLALQSTLANRAADLARVTNQIKSGRNSGTWNGTGISSTTAALDGTQLSAIGVILNDDLNGGAIYDTFAGQSVDANTILVTLTSYGDADLNGAIDSTDYSLIDNGFNFGLSGWLNGDFNYDGTINSADYALIDNAFGLLGGPSAPEMVALHAASFGQPYLDALASLQAVPEPSTFALLAVGAAGLLLRRQRKLRQTFACGAVATLLGAASMPAEAGLVVNLRLAGGGITQTLTSSDVGTNIPIQVWASVTNVGGVNGSGIHEGLQYLTYSLTSERLVAGPGGSINGDLHTPSLAAPFDANGSSAGEVSDLNGDGIDDLGSLAADPNSLFAKPRSAAATYDTTPGITGQAITGGFEFLVETIEFHVDSLPASPPSGNGTRFHASLPSWMTGFAKGANWFQDSNLAVSNGANNGAYTSGTTVTFDVASVPSFILGDMDGDGDVDNFDIQPFEQALTDRAGWEAQWDLHDAEQRGDIDGDGDLDNFDITPFEQLVVGGGPLAASVTAAVPEPATIVPAAMGLALLFWFSAKRR